jgi:hypothetical protein
MTPIELIITPIELIITYYQWYILVGLGMATASWRSNDNLTGVFVSILFGILWPILFINYLIRKVLR